MQLWICNYKKKEYHCKYGCFHGTPHTPDIGKDSCKIPEFCDIVGKRIKCRKLYKKEEKELL